MIQIVFSSIGLLAALLYLLRYASALTHSWPATASKTASVLALAAAAWGAGAPGLITAGLVCGAIGDFALSRPGDRWFLAGMAAFALGHLAYAAAFVAAELPGPLWAVLGLALLIGSTEVWLAPRTGALRWPVRAYVAVIGAMALAALTRGPEATVLHLGVALFVASDLLLAVDRFVLAPGPAGLRRAVWISYWAAQAVILWGSSSL